MKIIKKIFSGIIDFLMVLIILFAVFVTIISLTADNNKVSKIGNYIPLNVKTDSMKPAIEKGDFIIVKECNPETLKVGDVISFLATEQNKTIIKTHRIVFVDESSGSKSFVTRGDNNTANDNVPVFPNDVIGKWDDVKLSNVGKVLDFVSSKLGFLFIIIVPLLILFVYQIYKFIIVIIEEKSNAKKLDDKEKVIETEEHEKNVDTEVKQEENETIKDKPEEKEEKTKVENEKKDSDKK